jgi:peroxiredoxin
VAIEPKLVPVGVQAPDFTLPNAMGGDITLSDYRGKACVVLVFLRGFM